VVHATETNQPLDQDIPRHTVKGSWPPLAKGLLPYILRKDPKSVKGSKKFSTNLHKIFEIPAPGEGNLAYIALLVHQ
jgi:hypothetical protein